MPIFLYISLACLAFIAVHWLVFVYTPSMKSPDRRQYESPPKPSLEDIFTSILTSNGLQNVAAILGIASFIMQILQWLHVI
jgi:uncharacterized membrane protein YkgB